MTAQQLKKSILQMAVQGKLVPQNPDDEPASVLLEHVRKEKERLIKEKKIKREKNNSIIFRGADKLPYEKVGNNEPVCIADEVPFEIPESWEWVRLGSLGEIVGGGTPKTNTPSFWDKGTIPWITPADMKYVTGKYVDKGERNITEDGLNGSSARIMPVGTIVYSSRAPIGYIAIASTELCTNQGFKSLVPIITSIDEYIYYCLITLTPEIQSRASGTTFKEISGAEFGKTLIPLPPLEEQKRIVMQIEAVLPSLNEYDMTEQDLRSINVDFPIKLRNSILQWAVQGNLVPQDPADEPAETLLERIRVEKRRLIKEGKIKKDKQESIIFRRDNSHYEKRGSKEVCINEEIPFEIPENWRWSRLGSITTVQSSKRVFEKDYVDVGIPFFRSKEIGNLYRGEAIHTQLFITREHYEQLKRDYGVPQLGDILITSVGTIGNSWICDGREFYYKDGNITQICSNKYLFPQYIQLFINSPMFTEQAQATVSGTAYNALTITKLKNMLIPLPPLSEQRRIVEKQKELFDIVTYI